MRATYPTAPRAAGAARRPSPRLRHHGRHGPGERHRLSDPAAARCRGPGPVELGARHRGPPRAAASPPVLRALGRRPCLRRRCHRPGTPRRPRAGWTAYAPARGELTMRAPHTSDAPRPGPAPPRAPPRPARAARRTGTPSGWPSWWRRRMRPTASSGANGRRCSATPSARPSMPCGCGSGPSPISRSSTISAGGWRQLRQQAAFAPHRHRRPGAGHGRVGHRLQRRDPAAASAATIPGCRSGRDALAAPRPTATGTADVAPGNFLDWRERATSFVSIAGAEPYSYDYTGGERPEVLRAAQVTEGFFDVFGLPPLAGRYFRPEEHKKGANRVAVDQRAAVAQPFGADPAAGRACHPSRRWRLYGRRHCVGRVPAAPVRDACRRQRVIWTAKAIEDNEARIRAPATGKSRADWPRAARWTTRARKWTPLRHESRSSSRARTRVRAWSCCPSGSIWSATCGRP